jgi:type I restriction enzyme, S subunit
VTELKPGWAVARFDELAEVRLGRQRSPKNHSGSRMRPYLRAANVTWGGLDLEDVKQMNFTEEESVVYELRPGDVLVAEASGSADEVGKPAAWRGEIDGCCFQNTLIRVRTLGPLPEYLRYFLLSEARSGRIGRASPGVGIHHIGATRLAAWQVPVAPHAEQRRIVAAIEEQLSRLDAAEAALEAAQHRLHIYRLAVLHQELARVSGSARPVRDLGGSDEQTAMTGPFGASLGSEDFVESGVPVFTIGALQESGIDRSRLKYVRPEKAAELRRYRLESGDILFSRMATVGRVGVVDDPLAGSLFNYHIIRLRLDRDVIDPDYFVVYVRGSEVVREYLRDVNRGATRDGVNTSLLMAMPVVVPPLAEQTAVVARVHEAMARAAALGAALEEARRRSSRCRLSVLDAAFGGRLVAQHPDDEPATGLIRRIAAERAEAPKRARKRREVAQA